MRQIYVSVLSLFIVLPALADARLPVVNVAAGGVSARAAFGLPVEKKVVKTVQNNNKKQEVSDARTVVARSTKKTSSVKQSENVSVDAGEQLFASADVLVPRRPSSDLWARNDTPLRLPQPDEFSVMRSDFALPEESLDVASNSTSYSNTSTELKSSDDIVSDLDAQIARLNELQRRADNSVLGNKFAAAKTARTDDASAVKNSSDDVNVGRMVVPMDQDVVVRAVQKAESPRITSTRNEMTKMTPTELRKAFRKTFLSENKHLSTFQIDDRFDVASDMTSSVEGFTSERDLSETGGIRPLEIKIKFRNDDSALSRDNYNLLTEYANIVLSNPTRAVQVSIPERSTRNIDDRKLAARRLAIVEQVLRDTGVSEQRILPVLSQRDEEGFVLRMISLDQYETMTQQQRDMFGDTISKKSYKSMSW